MVFKRITLVISRTLLAGCMVCECSFDLGGNFLPLYSKNVAQSGIEINAIRLRLETQLQYEFLPGGRKLQSPSCH